MATSSSDWVEDLYEHAIFHGQAAASSSFGLSDATSMAATSGASDHTTNPSSSIAPNGDQLTPKGCVSKPIIRRRSRASKKTPVTLLNANTANFRALVQQFTGCPSNSAVSFGSQNGPINLDFGLGSVRNNHSYATTEMAPFDINSYHHRIYSQMQQPGLNVQQHHLQEQGFNASLDHNLPRPASDAYFLVSSGLEPNLDMTVADHDGLFTDDVALQELGKESF